MNKILLTTLVAAGVLGMAAQAHANAFFGLRGGFEKYKADNSAQNLEEGKTDFMIDGFVGYHYSFFRVEAEYGYHPERSFQGGATKMESQTVMGNLYFSPPMKSAFHPYVMGGAGVVFHSTDVGTESDSNTTFAWQMGGGLELEFTENVFFDVGGRWLDMGQAEMKSNKYDIKGLSYYMGLRFEY